MKTITEDQVLSLMEGLRARERDALRDLARAVDAGALKPAGSAKIFDFARGTRRAHGQQKASGEVVSLAASRAARNARATSRGVFVYATEGPTPA